MDVRFPSEVRGSVRLDGWSRPPHLRCLVHGVGDFRGGGQERRSGRIRLIQIDGHGSGGGYETAQNHAIVIYNIVYIYI